MANDLLSQSDSLESKQLGCQSEDSLCCPVTGTTGTRCHNSFIGSKAARLCVQRMDPTWLPGISAELQTLIDFVGSALCRPIEQGALWAHYFWPL